MGRMLWYSALCTFALWCAAGSQSGAHASPPTRTLSNLAVGYSLSYPRGWKVRGRVVATEFAARAVCQSVRVVDFAPPPNAGPSIQVRHAFVQICWHRVDGSSLDEFMREQYRGKLFGLFERASLAAVPAYRTREGGLSTTYFLQTAKHRVQIVAAVATEPALRARRRAQVARILASFTLAR